MQKRTVLVVDDQKVNRDILGKLLEEEYNILYAENGKEAMSQLEKYTEEISVILLDIVMPVMDGYAVLKAMQGDQLLSKIPVIVSSQRDGDEAEIKALALGAQDFIAKPYKGDIIRHRIENTIRFRENAAMVNKVEKDQLTGLYNKQFFIDKVEKELKENPDKRYDLICICVENFQLVNEAFGMVKGDELLKHLAGLVQEFNPELRICGRFSADDFFTLVPHKEWRKREFEQLAKNVNEMQIDMTLRIRSGIYIVEDRSIKAAEMCKMARMAARTAKVKPGAMFAYYDEALRHKAEQEQFILSNMYTALEQKQFEIYYQPKYELSTELVVGAEALVRWIHPEKGMISPGEFIPLFESNGFITQLDIYVWKRVCQDIREWIDQGQPMVSVSVNVSRADILNSRLAEILTFLVHKYKIPFESIHLEITESAYTENADEIIATVAHLRSLGFIIEMDDFGSGYSSLNMLAEMPVDILKLDMKFVQHERKKEESKGILNFVISLAKWLNISVIAEGVENGEQIATLRAMDCNYVQGFYFAKPMKKKDFEELIRTTRTVLMQAEKRKGEVCRKHIEDENPDIHKGVMLLVDDIDVNRAILASIFIDEYTIVEKGNGKDAWDYLQKNSDNVEVIMLDLMMPVMDGFELLKLIRLDERMRDLPVIITALGEVETERRSLSMQADDFISKPYKADMIAHRVNNVVANCKYIRQKNRMNERIQQQNAVLQNFVDSIDGGIGNYIAEEDGKLTLTYVSSSLGRMVGMTKEEYMEQYAQDAMDFIYSADRDKVKIAVLDTLRNGKTSRVYFRAMHKDGTNIWLSGSYSKTGEIHGKPTLCAVFAPAT